MEKISREEAITILNQYIDSILSEEQWFCRIKPYIKAIIFYGSTAKNNNRAESDLDICIILPIRIEEKFTQGEYSYDHQGQEINIVIRSIERLRQLAGEQKDEFQKNVFEGGKILFENDNEVRNLLNEWGVNID